jgi:succinate-acetate transporter protein
VFGVFLTLELTEILLFIGNFVTKTAVIPPMTDGSWIEAGGYVGVLTALVAWYASAALVINGMKGKQVVPVGRPLLKLGD